jgi:uncharacterized membrane protein YfcA
VDIYLPIAEISINALGLLALGAVVGFLSGLFGVGGGFILTPLLTFMGVPPTIAVGTQANQLAGTSLSGALAQWRRRNIDLKMGTVLMLGSFVGTALGVQIFAWLQEIGQINLVIKISYVTLLSFVGTMMLLESAPYIFKNIKRIRGPSFKPREKVEEDESGVVMGRGAQTSFGMTFPRSNLRLSVFFPLGVGFVGGVLVALLGVGGGFVMVPAMIYLLGMPPSLVSGTSLFQILFTTAFATILQAVSNQSVDLILALILLIGSVVAVPFGTRIASRLRPEVARFLMAALILIVAAKLVHDLLVMPDQLYSVDMRKIL